LKELLQPSEVELDETARNDVRDLGSTLLANVGKIKQHGERADEIVRSMLSHARDAPSALQPLDLNGLLKDSLNFSYHAARAENQSFNVRMKSA